VKKADTNSRLHEALLNFDFSGGADYTYQWQYDLRKEDDIQLLDGDSADAASVVKDRDLSYEIDAKHKSTVEDGDRIVDWVSVTWRFWKDG
jgi:hypothetical protein